MSRIDQIIDGSFDAVGAPPSYISPAYNPADYASIYKPTGGITPAQLAAIRAVPARSHMQPASVGSPYMTAAERAQLEQQVADSRYLQATMGKTPTAVATGPAWNQPTAMDLAAIDAANKPKATAMLPSLLAYGGVPDTAVNPAVAAATAAGAPVTNVTAPIKPQGGGGLFEMLFGPAKNGMGGLAGLLGGPGAGGPLGMLLDGQATGAPAPAPPPRIGPTGTAAGYVYENGRRVGRDPAFAGLKPGEMYAALNNRNPSGGSSSSGMNSNGNWFDSSSGQWNYSDPKHRGFDPGNKPKGSGSLMSSNGSLI